MTSRSSGTYVPPPGRNGCSSGKVGFYSRKQARTARGKIHGDAIGIYRCDECAAFHLGHKPQKVRNGEIDKAAWLRATQGGNA